MIDFNTFARAELARWFEFDRDTVAQLVSIGAFLALLFLLGFGGGR